MSVVCESCGNAVPAITLGGFCAECLTRCTLDGRQRRAIYAAQYRRAIKGITPNTPWGYSAQQVAAAKGIARRRALKIIDAISEGEPVRYQAPNWQRPGVVSYRVVDVTHDFAALEPVGSGLMFETAAVRVPLGQLRVA